MRVFLSHCSKDKPRVEILATALRKRGLDVWLDMWEMQAGANLAGRINQALEQSDAGLVVFSHAAAESRWVTAESRYLIWAHVEEGKLLVPVTSEHDAPIPALVRPLLRRGIEEVDAIEEALRGRRAGKPPLGSPADGRVERVRISLERTSGGISVEARLGPHVFGQVHLDAMPAEVLRGDERFRQAVMSGARRDWATAERISLEGELAALGRALRDLCLPKPAEAALAELLAGAPIHTRVEVCFESADSQLLGLPFEALRLADDRLLATHDKVVLVRRLSGVEPARIEPFAGPLKILVAVGAPDEGKTANVVLDQERELQSILDAVEAAERRESLQVRILEVGSPKQIGEALEQDAYHVLHLSCHGEPGRLELEDEDGAAVSVSAEDLLGPLHRQGRPLPLVFLNTCHGAVRPGAAASLAEQLLRQGVGTVLAMQKSVTDHYATLLAGRFYAHLARKDAPLASRALAASRRELEHGRQQAIATGHAAPHETQPEVATATLFVSGQEAPLLDPSPERVPLRQRPVRVVAGPVPQLRMDDLIGRRQELRQTLRTLRDSSRQLAGVSLTGIGGVGKSALAGRVMQRLQESGWLVAAVAGRLDASAIAAVIGTVLVRSGQTNAALMSDPRQPDVLRLQLAAGALAEQPVLLVLDDFEQNLSPDGSAFLREEAFAILKSVLQSCARGRVLITCRYPLPGIDTLKEIALGPLSRAESGKLLRRLDELRGRAPAEVRTILGLIGGHPRMLEFVDALLRGGRGRLQQVTKKLRGLREQAGLAEEVSSLDESLRQAIQLGARDVFLKQLLDSARLAGTDQALLLTAVSNLPVSPRGVAWMLAGEPPTNASVDEAEQALDELSRLSLVHRWPDGDGWVHRWTAEGLIELSDSAQHRDRCRRAGAYRTWRAQNESPALEDLVEAVRNFVAGKHFDDAGAIAEACLEILKRGNQIAGVAGLASELLETWPPEHGSFGYLAYQEAQALTALGLAGAAFRRYQSLLEHHLDLVQAHPNELGHLRSLSVVYNNIGDLYRALGEGEQARC